MKQPKHPELTALAWAALAAIRRDKEAEAKAAEASETRRDSGEEAVDLSE